MAYPKNRKSRIYDMTGKKYNRLLAVRFDRIENKCSFWLFKCDCGKEKILMATYVRQGETKSCGCLTGQGGKYLRTHGLYKQFKKEWWIWSGMRNRCSNKKEKCYKNYGGRGIMVCDRWQKFENFIEDMGPRPSERHTIERRDNDAGYCKENCSWELPEVQQNNKRNTIRIEWNGKVKPITQWAHEIGVLPATLYKRIVLSNWPLERAFVKENNNHLPIRKTA